MPHSPFRQDSRFGNFDRFQGGFPGAQSQQLGQQQSISFGEQPFGGNLRPRFERGAQGRLPQGGQPPGGVFPPPGGFPQQIPQQIPRLPQGGFTLPPGGGFAGGIPVSQGGTLQQPPGITPPQLQGGLLKPGFGGVTPGINPFPGGPQIAPPKTDETSGIGDFMRNQLGGGIKPPPDQIAQPFPPGQTPGINPFPDGPQMQNPPALGLGPQFPGGGLPGTGAPGGQQSIQDILALIQGQAGGFDPSNAFAGLVQQTPQFEQPQAFTPQDLLGTINQPVPVPQGPIQRPGGGFGGFGGFRGGRGSFGGRPGRPGQIQRRL